MGKHSVIIFGASGSIGQAICHDFLSRNWQITAVSRAGTSSAEPLSRACWVAWDSSSGRAAPFPPVAASAQFDAVVWAQGANCSDDIFSFDLDAHEALYAANVTYILVSLQTLLKQDLLAPGSRLCVISSIWQNLARQNKLSYCITKSAIEGLVLSLSVDLGRKGFLVNAVLPGPLDTPMTRANLTADQILRLEQMTPLGKLADLADVCKLAAFLSSPDNLGITGQFIAADKGFSYARLV